VAGDTVAETSVNVAFVFRGSGLPMVGVNAASTYERRWRMRPGSGSRHYPMVSPGLHYIADPRGSVQPLHGVTFALLHLVCMRVIVLAVSFRLAATAQSIYGTLCIGWRPPC